MKFVTKYLLCALLSIGLAYTTHAKQDEKKENKDKGKGDKVEAVYQRDKKNKVPVCATPRHDPSDRPFSVPDASSTLALLGLSIAVVWLAQRKWASSLMERR